MGKFSVRRLGFLSSAILLVSTLVGCGSLVSDRFDAKALDRINAVEVKILTQFDRLLNTPLVCRPGLIASEEFKNSYGDIEVLLRVHLSSEQYRPSNVESTRIAGMFLVHWQVHRAFHRWWNLDTKTRIDKLTQLQSGLNKELEQSLLSSEVQVDKKAENDLFEHTMVEVVQDAAMASRIAYATKTCDLVKKGAITLNPRSDQAAAELQQLHRGSLGDAALQNSRDMLNRYVRAAMVIEEARKLVLAPPKAGS